MAGTDQVVRTAFPPMRILNVLLSVPRPGLSELHSLQDERNLLNQDLNAVLGGKMPREYGVMPESTGAFERVAPSRVFDEIQRLVKAGPRA